MYWLRIVECIRVGKQESVDEIMIPVCNVICIEGSIDQQTISSINEIQNPYVYIH